MPMRNGSVIAPNDDEAKYESARDPEQSKREIILREWRTDE